MLDMLINNPVSQWEFLDEELYRWALFIGAFLLLLIAWRSVLNYMKL